MTTRKSKKQAPGAIETEPTEPAQPDRLPTGGGHTVLVAGSNNVVIAGHGPATVKVTSSSAPEAVPATSDGEKSAAVRAAHVSGKYLLAGGVLSIVGVIVGGIFLLFSKTCAVDARRPSARHSEHEVAPEPIRPDPQCVMLEASSGLMVRADGFIVDVDGGVKGQVPLGQCIRMDHLDPGQHVVTVRDDDGFVVARKTINVRASERRYTVALALGDGDAPDYCAAPNRASIMTRGREHADAQDWARAADCYRFVCRADGAQGCLELSWLLDAHQDLPRVSADETRSAAERACTHRVQAGCERAVQAADAHGQIHPRAREHLEAACQSGRPTACNLLGTYIRTEKQGVRGTSAEARELFRIACEGDVDDGCASYGYMAFNGLGGAEDRPAAITAWEHGCGSSAAACFWLVDKLRQVPQGVAPNASLARRALRTGCHIAPDNEHCTPRSVPAVGDP